MTDVRKYRSLASWTWNTRESIIDCMCNLMMLWWNKLRPGPNVLIMNHKLVFYLLAPRRCGNHFKIVIMDTLDKYKSFFNSWTSYCKHIENNKEWTSQIARFMGPTWDPPGSCRPQVGSMLASWISLSGTLSTRNRHSTFVFTGELCGVYCNWKKILVS